MPNGWYLEPVEKDPTTKIIVGVVAVGAIALGVVLATRGGDEGGGGSSRPPATTVVAGTTTLVGTTTTLTGTTTTTSSTPAGTTPNGPVDGAALVAAMPTAADLPSDWSQYREADPNAVAGDGPSYCDQIDEVTRALAADGVVAYGPRYDLPTGSWFGYDVLTFPTNDAAAEFMMDSRDHANLCSSTPISYTEVEADMGFLNDQFSDDIVWNVQEASAASAGQFLDGEGIVRITVEMRYTTQAEGATLSVNETILVLYEQHGRTVVEYWVGGNWNFAGMGTAQPDHAHQPQQTELDAAADMVGSVLLPNLTSLGVV
jgi:hypothetical protein